MPMLYRTPAAKPNVLSGRAILDALVDAGALRIPGRTAVDALPAFAISAPTADRWRGMLLGLAIGDALGNTSEGLSPSDRARQYREIRDYLPHWEAGDRRVGLPSDDTQLAFWTVELWLEDGRLDPQRLARCFASRQIRGVGASVRSFVAAFRSGRPWPEASSASAGNGALMRIAPVVLPHLGGSSTGLWADAILCGAVTHNDPASISACTAFSGMLAELLAMSTTPEPRWWLDRYVALARPLEGTAVYQPTAGQPRDFAGSLSSYVERCVPAAFEAGRDARSACEAWHSGAYLLETVPSALYILMRHAHDPEEAIIRAVNDTSDNDTIAAIVGAAVGALHGETALPRRWRDNLLGRTMDRDDGRIFALLAMVEGRMSSA